ncbi:MAG: Trm112 family protein [Kangiellaceae bacterium]|jgi:uncharacterized protein
MNKSLLEIIVCPICHGKVSIDKTQSKLICRFDRLAYPIDDGIPVMLSDRAESLTSEQVEQSL